VPRRLGWSPSNAAVNDTRGGCGKSGASGPTAETASPRVDKNVAASGGKLSRAETNRPGLQPAVTGVFPRGGGGAGCTRPLCLAHLLERTQHAKDLTLPKGALAAGVVLLTSFGVIAGARN